MRNKTITYTFAGIMLLSVALLSFQCGNSGAGSAADKIKRGEYLVTFGGCSDCHTPKVFTEKGMEFDSERLLSGHPADEKLPQTPMAIVGPGKWGAVTNHNLTAWVGPWGTSFAANLTPDMVTGSGAWTEESFIAAMRTGKHLGAGRDILPPMPWFNLALATDEDLSAIFACLKSLEPIENMVPAPIPPPGAPATGAAEPTGQ